MRLVKRLLDIAVSLVALILLSPAMLVAAVAIVRSMGRPVLFRQARPGLHARPFTLLKFRTMSDARGPGGEPLDDAARLTPLGQKLRSTSLDELPQLWNVLTGDMSLVGPRPLLLEYVPLYDDRQRRRMDVPPGITGWAQINGRNAISWEQRFELDVWYVEHWNLALDFKILLATFARVWKREGISAAGEATMPKFRGSSKPNTMREDKA